MSFLLETGSSLKSASDIYDKFWQCSSSVGAVRSYIWYLKLRVRSVFDLICQNTEIMSLRNVFGRNSKTIFKLLRHFSSQIQSWCNKMFTDLEYENSTYSGVNFGNLSKSLSWRHYFWVLSDKIESTDPEYCPR